MSKPYIKPEDRGKRNAPTIPASTAKRLIGRFYREDGAFEKEIQPEDLSDKELADQARIFMDAARACALVLQDRGWRVLFVERDPGVDVNPRNAPEPAELAGPGGHGFLRIDRLSAL